MYKVQDIVSGKNQPTKSSARIIFVQLSGKLDITQEALTILAEMGYSIRAGLGRGYLILERTYH